MKTIKRKIRDINIFKFLYESGLFKNRTSFCYYTDINLSYLTRLTKKTEWWFSKNKSLILEIKNIIENAHSDVFEIVKKMDYEELYIDLTTTYLLNILEYLPKKNYGYGYVFNQIIGKIKNDELQKKVIEFIELTEEYEILQGM